MKDENEVLEMLPEDLTNAGYITGELLPCPFCGHTQPLTSGKRNTKTGNIVYTVSCGNILNHCLANIFVCIGKDANTSRDEAVRRWNTRSSLLQSDKNPEGSDTTKADSSNGAKSIHALYQKITSNGNREMTEERFVQAVKELQSELEEANKENERLRGNKEDILKIRNYFGENDKTPFEHWAYTFLNNLLNNKA